MPLTRASLSLPEAAEAVADNAGRMVLPALDLRNGGGRNQHRQQSHLPDLRRHAGDDRGFRSILSEQCLRGLVVTRELPNQATAGQSSLVGLTVSNRKRNPSFGILVEDEKSARRQSVLGRCQFPIVPAGRTEQRAYSWEPSRRGKSQFQRLRVATRFPFGLFEKSMIVELPDEILVWPAALPCDQPTRSNQLQPGESNAGRAGPGIDPWELRPHRSNDDPRAIAWAASARTGQLLILERERQRRDAVPPRAWDGRPTRGLGATSVSTGLPLGSFDRRGERGGIGRTRGAAGSEGRGSRSPRAPARRSGAGRAKAFGSKELSSNGSRS